MPLVIRVIVDLCVDTCEFLQLGIPEVVASHERNLSVTGFFGEPYNLIPFLRNFKATRLSRRSVTKLSNTSPS